MTQTVSIACAGDVLVTRELTASARAGLLGDLSRIWDGCTARFANLETLFHDYECPAMSESGGTWVRSDPVIARELRELGIDLVSNANNHSGDYAWPALVRTCEVLNEAGIVHAGAGPDLATTREAAFLETPGARIAVLAATATFPTHAMAGAARSGIPARPGISYLRYRVEHELPSGALRALRSIAGRFEPQESADRVTLGPLTFRDGPGYQRTSYCEPEDLGALAAAVQEARQVADLVLVGLHSHEPGADWDEPAPFLIDAAHEIADAGADLVVANGPHMVAGVERRGGGVIFYGLGSLFFQNSTPRRYPADACVKAGLAADAGPSAINMSKWDFSQDERYWETMVPVCTWDGGKLTRVELHPLALHQGPPAAIQGMPYAPDAARSRKILERVALLSRPFGTSITLAPGAAAACVELS